MIDAARLADELRAEQENAQMAERGRSEGGGVLDYKDKDMQTRRTSSPSREADSR